MMDKRTKNDGGHRRVFISYPDPNAARVKAAFDREIMRLLTMSPRDYVATADVEATMTAFSAGAAQSEAERRDEDDVDMADMKAAIDASELPRPDLASLLRDRMRRESGFGDADLLPKFLNGAHLAEALMASHDVIGSTRRRPAERAICVVSAKAGTGKTMLLAHLASEARRQRDRRIAVIDLAWSEADQSRGSNIIGEVSSADLVIVDNASDAPSAPDRAALWSMLHQQLSSSASIVITANSDLPAEGNAPWRALPGSVRDVTIGSFDCAFRRNLIGSLSRRRQTTGEAAMPQSAINRLAEELWGNGWQLGAAVDAYGAYQLVMARTPTATEIDTIAANVVSQDMWASPSIETITEAASRFDDPEMRSTLVGNHHSPEATRDVALYLAKTLTKQPLGQLARQFGLRRRSAVQAMHRIERSQTAASALSHAQQIMKAEIAYRAL